MRKLILLLLTALTGQFSHAQFSGGLGLFSHNTFRVTSSSSGEKGMLGTTYFPMIGRYETMPLLGEMRLAPYLSFTYLTTLLLPVETPDKTAKKNFAILAVPALLPVGPNWFVSGGPGLMYYEIKGNGGTKVVNNGTGTSTFGVPSKTVSSKIFLIELGTGWLVNNWRINLDLYFSGFASERLSTSFQASMSYSFGGRTW